MIDNLQPCKMCGSKDIITYTRKVSHFSHRTDITCQDCYYQVSKVERYDMDAERKATAAWNYRVEPCNVCCGAKPLKGKVILTHYLGFEISSDVGNFEFCPSCGKRLCDSEWLNLNQHITENELLSGDSP